MRQRITRAGRKRGQRDSGCPANPRTVNGFFKVLVSDGNPNAKVECCNIGHSSEAEAKECKAPRFASYRKHFHGGGVEWRKIFVYHWGCDKKCSPEPSEQEVQSKLEAGW